MYLTAVFRLRVSQRKRKIIDLALREYEDLQAWLLTWAREEVDRIESRARTKARNSDRIYYRAQRVQSHLPCVRECPGVIHSALKNAARYDVAMMLAGYLARKARGWNPGFPSIQAQRLDEYIAALEELDSAIEIGESTWLKLQQALASEVRENAPTLWLPGMRAFSSRSNAALLVNTDTGRYVALLYLLPGDHYLCKPLRTKDDLVPVGVEDPVPFVSRSRTAILCPIECGRWHREKFLTSGAVPAAARLRRDLGGNYYLAVAFEMQDPDTVPLTGSVMAVMGSETGMLAYAVATSTGDILEAGDYPDEAGSLRKSRAGWRREKQRRQRRGRSTAGLTLRGRTKHTIHTVINDLVGKAVNHGARILVESPAASEVRQREDVPMAEVRRVLSYKAQLAGLPTPRWARTWRYVDKYDGFIPLGDICASCGRVLTLTRPHSTISCPACGELDYAVNWSMVVASSAAER